MHVVVNITSDSEFPFIALLDIVLKEVGERETFYHPRHKEAGRTRSIKHTEISIPEEPTIVFASKGFTIPHPFNSHTTLETGFSPECCFLFTNWEDSIKSSSFCVLYVLFSLWTHLFSLCSLYLDRNCYNDRKCCLCFAPWPHGNA